MEFQTGGFDPVSFRRWHPQANLAHGLDLQQLFAKRHEKIFDGGFGQRRSLINSSKTAPTSFQTVFGEGESVVDAGRRDGRDRALPISRVRSAGGTNRVVWVQGQTFILPCTARGHRNAMSLPVGVARTGLKIARRASGITPRSSRNPGL